MGEICMKHKIYQPIIEPYSLWQNHDESTGGILKCKVKRINTIHQHTYANMSIMMIVCLTTPITDSHKQHKYG